MDIIDADIADVNGYDDKLPSPGKVSSGNMSPGRVSLTKPTSPEKPKVESPVKLSPAKIPTSPEKEPGKSIAFSNP
jgi:hypothetical protein